MRRIFLLFVFPAILLLSVACILTSPPAAPTATPDAAGPTPADAATATAAVPVDVTATMPADPTTACPAATGDSSQYISRENGFCFLVPAGYRVEPDGARPQESVMLIGPVAPGDGMERPSVMIWVANNGPARGLNSDAYGRRWHENFVGAEAPLEAETGTIGGYPALFLNNLPGMFSRRGGFVVANDFKYELMLLPQPGTVPELEEAASAGYATVLNSIVFFPPQNDRVYRTAEEACPAATADTLLMVNEANGYCFLYPADFEISPMANDWVVGGPVLGSVEGFGDVRTSLSPGTFGAFPDRTPREMLNNLDTTMYDAASVYDLTIGGFPAVAYKNISGPWASRNAFINVNGMVYTIVTQPWEPERWPAGMPHLERVWTTVTESMQFFTPWR